MFESPSFCATPANPIDGLGNHHLFISVGHYLRNTLFGVGLAKPGSCRYSANNNNRRPAAIGRNHAHRPRIPRLIQLDAEDGSAVLRGMVKGGRQEESYAWEKAFLGSFAILDRRAGRRLGAAR